MTVSVAPPFFYYLPNNNNTGAPAAGFKLFTYIAGTSTKQATWVDSTQTTQNDNPILLDANGFISKASGDGIWFDPTLSYKLVLALPSDTDPPSSPIRTLDNVQGFVTQSIVSSLITAALIGAALYPQSTSETNAGVTAVNLQYPYGYPERFATNTTPGTTDMTVAVQSAINWARYAGETVTLGTTWPYLVTSPLNCTTDKVANGGRQMGWRIVNIGNQFPQSSSPYQGVIHAKHTGVAVFDMAGAYRIDFDRVSVSTDTVTYPKTCFFQARNGDGPASNSQQHRFLNTYVFGSFSVAVQYNYGSEDGVYNGNFWTNNATDAGACVVALTVNNYFKGSAAFLSSPNITIATGSTSTLDHEYFGGQYNLSSASTTGDVVYLEGGVGHADFINCWMNNNNASTHGRSFFYNDTANSVANWIRLVGIEGEVSTNFPQYGIFVGTVAGTPVSWSVRDCYFPTNTSAIATSTGVILSQWRIDNLTESATKGINVPTTVQDSTINYPGTITIGTSLRNLLIVEKTNVTITTRSADVIIDLTAGQGTVLSSAGMGIWGNAATGQSSGWGTPSGAAVVNNYTITDAGGANSNTNKAVAQIIVMLKSLGLFAA